MQNSTETPRNSRAMQARLNGAKSRGPITPQGKLNSSQNAIKHGLHSPKVVLQHENPSEFDALLAEYSQQYLPQNPTEHDLVLDMATARWRIQRCQRIESALYDQMLIANAPEFNERNAADPEGPAKDEHRLCEAWRDLVQNHDFDRLAQQEARFHRLYTRALTTLLKLRRTPEYKNPQNEPNESEPNTEIDTNELPTLTKNHENEPSNPLKTQRERILDYCNSEAYLNTFAPRLQLVHQGKLTYDQYLAEIRESVATLLNIKNHQNEPSKWKKTNDAA